MPEKHNHTQDLNYVDKPKKLFIITTTLYVLIFGLFLAAAFFFKFPVSFNTLMLSSEANHIRLVAPEDPDKLNPGDEVQLSVHNNKQPVQLSAVIVSKEKLQKGVVITVDVTNSTGTPVFTAQPEVQKIPVIVTKKQRLINFLFDKI